ncbi:ABC transporter ATP-binding protein [Phytohabitans suffuscus]|uniref:ABC transporter ATPase n=1 Tax=Phytohabitans suffuscus TaxID=624315 RepID=A0A6F8YVG4_9ACTN|nr:ABC transporter ATP-binding protein [Phytohabitans suffuscus]BCB90046.1 ABC transporter ATPase [Phytohabitans suffuscus]
MSVNVKTQPVLQVSGIRKTYPGEAEPLVVLDDVSLTAYPGELVSIIGPSGCGKTTLLRIIDGLIPHDGGQVKVLDQVVDEPPTSIAVVFQDGRLLPWRTVVQNVEFALELQVHRRLNKQEKERAREFVDAVGLGNFMKHYPHQLSGGMQQRVGVARALARVPDLLLLDEPFGALDAQTRLVMQDWFLSLQRRYSLAAVLVTHDIDEAVYMSKRCVVLTRQPGRVKRVVEFELPDARDRQDVRSLPEFGHYRSQLWQLLRDDAISDAER